jgi:uncharacterized membrane protein YcgQ (UPF0703/DUF1980 family)
MPSPVYLFTGFLDAGKTTLIKDTLSDEGFMEGINRTLLLCFEQGEVPYEEDFCEAHHLYVEYFDDPADLTPAKIKDLDTIYHPDQVMIEWNGTVPVPDLILSGLPSYWPLVQILTEVDATTFELYMNAMRSMLFEQLRYSDTIIVNRCTPDTDGRMLRGNIKAINRNAQIFYEGSFGEPVQLKQGLLPFDLNADVLDIKDDDYGLWYMDCVENPMKYANKKIILRGYYAENIPGYKQTFIMGRRAMVCCAADTSLCGITVTGVKIWEMKLGDWIEVEGELRPVDMNNGAKTVVLYATRCSRYHKPEQEYVTFS